MSGIGDRHAGVFADRFAWNTHLEERREQALAGLDAGLRSTKTDPTELRLAEAHKRLGEALMENELLRKRCRRQGIPLPAGRSKR